ncbi:MBL fold metallo-hydrolase [Natranaerofaba carboxydovora]|uniref:MBL fold metallo-hydrolase n=1 Tax=Natranaerofaba carboxydovora TaxID=2742683 RepID=UPI001F12DA57|nr:MBL fold metallo-hydrolase [Natranaerofaba carboxydovora]UMZ72579.1 Metallo-beta-lactamase superfamily protein [Natranaerofaba carboxydovora]
MQLKHIKGKCFYIPNPANIGVIKGETGVILVDTGLDDDTGRKIIKTLEENDLSPSAIINTHSHGDHYGGNYFIKNKTNVPIYAPFLEADIIENTYLEPYFLFSGAHPIKDLQNKFLMGKPTCIEKVIKDEEATIDGVELKIYFLPGHSPNQIGVKVDDVFFIGDAVFSTVALKKHKIPFYIDIDKQKNTLDFLRQVNESNECDYFLPGHGELSEDISLEIEANQSAINDIEKDLISLLSDKKSIEETMKEIFSKYNIKVKSVYQYFLMKTAVMAYLSYFHHLGKVSTILDDGSLYWQSSD